jgi:hypothetical protein
VPMRGGSLFQCLDETIVQIPNNQIGSHDSLQYTYCNR